MQWTKFPTFRELASQFFDKYAASNDLDNIQYGEVAAMLSSIRDARELRRRRKHGRK